MDRSVNEASTEFHSAQCPHGQWTLVRCVLCELEENIESLTAKLKAAEAKVEVLREGLDKLRKQARAYGNTGQSMIVPRSFFEVAHEALAKAAAIREGKS